jgi:hypothetical protein
MSAYQQFKTNKEVEKDGIILDYGTFYIRAGRAGGANQRFKKTMERLLKPHRRALQTETMGDKQLNALLIQGYAEGNVYGWGYKKSADDKEFIDGKVLDEDGNEMEFSQKNVIKLFTDLPDLFTDVQEQCGKVSLFRDFLDQEDAKNS